MIDYKGQKTNRFMARSGGSTKLAGVAGVLRQQVRQGRLGSSEHRRGLQLVADEDGSAFLLSEVGILFSALCGDRGRGMKLRFCANAAWVLVLGRGVAG